MKTLLMSLLFSSYVVGSPLDLTFRGAPYPSGTPVVIEYEDVQFPESTHFDEEKNLLFISNINGPGLAKDGNGWIGRVKTNPFSQKIEKWVSGLNAPKGMRAKDDRLWVADVDELVEISIKEGKVKQKIKIPGAKLLNDIVISKEGDLYISDTFGSTIFKWSEGKVSVFDSGEHLRSPNGIFLDENRLIVAAYGLAPGTWVPKTPGAFYTLDLKSKEKKLLVQRDFRSLDGLEKMGADEFLFTEGPTGTIYHYKNGTEKALLKGILNPADIGYHSSQKLLAIPRLGEDKVTIISLSSLTFNQGKVAEVTDVEFEAGRVKSATCVACHGKSDTSFLPIINGQKRSYIEDALKDFREGKRKDGFMGPAAANLTDNDITNLSKYYSQLRLNKKKVVALSTEAQKGKKLTASCISCHGVDGVSPGSKYPNLAGQRKDYLVKALKEFKQGIRINAPMKPFVSRLSEEDIEDISTYYSEL